MDLEDQRALERCADKVMEQQLTEEEWEGIQYKGLSGLQAVGYRCVERMMTDSKWVPIMERMLQHLQPVQRPNHVPTLQCIWHSDRQEEDDEAWFSKVIHLDAAPVQGRFSVSCDNAFVAYLNGRELGRGEDWQKVKTFDVGSLLVHGRNVLAVSAANYGGPAGLAAVLEWHFPDGSKKVLTSDTSWKVARTRPPSGWKNHPEQYGTWYRSEDVSEPTDNVMGVMKPWMHDRVDSSLEEILEFWQDWYRAAFHQPFVLRHVAESATTRGHAILWEAIKRLETFDGDRVRGRQAYIKGGCFACHGGLGDQEGTLFGPTLVGATQRLNREELADAIIYPSKQVPERFKASEMTLKDGRSISGFITGTTDTHVSITDMSNQVSVVNRTDIESLEAQDTSLMPEGLLQTFTDREITDLMTFIHHLE